MKKFWCPAPPRVVRWNEKIGLNFRSVRTPAQAGCATPQADKKPCFCGASCVFRQIKGAMPTATNFPAIRAVLDNRLRTPDACGPCPDTHENPPGLLRDCIGSDIRAQRQSRMDSIPYTDAWPFCCQPVHLPKLATGIERVVTRCLPGRCAAQEGVVWSRIS